MRAAPLSTYDEKLQWLRANRGLWKNYERHDARKRLIFEAMRRANLVSRTTYWKDVNLLGLIMCVEERE